jgi:hypothetical protein
MKLVSPLYSNYFILLFSLFFVSSTTACDQCQFDGTDVDDCKDYGLIDNSVLVAWPLGPQDCLDFYDISVTSGDPSIICLSANSFVNELRLGTSLEETKAGLGVQEGGFFNEDGTLKEQITVDGTAIDCEPTVENPSATALDCYDAMTTYFESFDGQREMLDVCDQLQLKTFNNKQLEQSTLRIRICSLLADDDGEIAMDTSCARIVEEVETQMSNYPDKDCSGFGFGTQSMTIPGCEDNGSGGGDDDGDDGGDESAAATTTVAALVVSMMMLLCL